VLYIAFKSEAIVETILPSELREFKNVFNIAKASILL